MNMNANNVRNIKSTATCQPASKKQDYLAPNMSFLTRHFNLSHHHVTAPQLRLINFFLYFYLSQV